MAIRNKRSLTVFLGTGLAALALGIGASNTPAAALSPHATGLGSAQVRPQYWGNGNDWQRGRDSDDWRLAEHRRYHRPRDRDDRRWNHDNWRGDRDDHRHGDRDDHRRADRDDNRRDRGDRDRDDRH